MSLILITVVAWILGRWPVSQLGIFGIGTTSLTRATLSVPLGLLIQGFVFFVLRLSGAVEFFPLACFLWAGLTMTCLPKSIPFQLGRPSAWEGWGLASALLGAVTIGAFWRNYPYGNMDAYSFWLLKARFLVMGGKDWTALYDPAYLNSDYPLLYPATVAAVWSWTRGVDLWAVLWLQIAFYWGILAIVYETVLSRVGTRLAIIALVLMSSNVLFLYRASCLYAELPLMFLFTLTASVATAKPTRREAVVMGLCCGFSVLVKQEGAIFALLGLIWQLRSTGSVRPRQVLWFVMAAAPGVMLHYYCRTNYVVVAPVLNPMGPSILTYLCTPERYKSVVESLIGILLNLRWWGLTAILPLGLLVYQAVRRRSACWPPLALGSSYACVMTAYFVVTPLAIEYHLRTAHERLMLQAWPLLVIAAFCSLQSRSVAQELAPRRGTSRNVEVSRA